MWTEEKLKINAAKRGLTPQAYQKWLSEMAFTTENVEDLEPDVAEYYAYMVGAAEMTPEEFAGEEE